MRNQSAPSPEEVQFTQETLVSMGHLDDVNLTGDNALPPSEFNSNHGDHGDGQHGDGRYRPRNGDHDRGSRKAR